jgi:hypothetical protein
MHLRPLLFGKPLRSTAEASEQITPAQGVPTLGLDALASASYGPEAALTVLLVAGPAASVSVVPVLGFVVLLLVILYFSYRQTIGAYPNGGGAFTVAKENIGPNAALIAAAALVTDYIMNAAVAISAGIGAIVSAVPSLLPYTLVTCLGVLVARTIVNLRGVRSTGEPFDVTLTFCFTSESEGIRPHHTSPPRDYGRLNVWDGSPIENRRVLVRCYHGLGDTVQFARYLPRLRDAARQVIVCGRRRR